MFGLAVIVFFVFYLAVSIGVTVLAVRWAKNRGRRAWLWGGLVAFIMYNLVFWDYLPTLITFKYLVHTRSGFWVYKTLEQWKAENPGVAETLTWKKLSPSYEATGITRGYKLNQRIGWVFIEHRLPILPVVTQEELIIDTKTDETLAKRVQIYSGSSSDLKFWTHLRQPAIKKKEFSELKKTYKQTGEEKR
ncbi:hypothetical protein UWK_03222 [Desulfocapsa sulfexigens DSM 10523]|uniref:Uncharacterized protein n=1 Tax=Desulfocapsa sulfexigens (strain DSM 10523 / SB164P1) TaxID=1167006 RepID=M1NJJ8_DESSD|nr:hypothetical protein [Desulfocapsa sulfexigens]AGF79749.1 hypothetical protein UWK_03222 [Desulfocapsa sulfexigens DSM 10523]